MKNLYLLPTDKPSRLHIAKNGDLHYSYEDVLHLVSANDKPHSIYITSDEKIEEGDYGVGFAYGIRGVGRGHYIFKQDGSNSGKLNAICDGAEKIILTTDQDLDGVQAIDDEFLEWFVKNPSCEEVKVESWEPYADFNFDYKIIIPKEEPKQDCKHDIVIKYGVAECQNCGMEENEIVKEEPKQETQGYICPQTQLQCKDECCVSAEDCHIEAGFGIIFDYEPPKQETLEKAAREYYKRGQLGFEKAADTEMAFLRGGLWQQQRMYSEEEVKEIIKLSCEEGMLIQRTINNKVKIPYMRIKDFTIKIFEQFKKK